MPPTRSKSAINNELNRRLGAYKTTSSTGGDSSPRTVYDAFFNQNRDLTQNENALKRKIMMGTNKVEELRQQSSFFHNMYLQTNDRRYLDYAKGAIEEAENEEMKRLYLTFKNDGSVSSNAYNNDRARYEARQAALNQPNVPEPNVPERPSTMEKVAKGLGQLGGRLIPGVGWGLAALDAYDFLANPMKVDAPTLEQPWEKPKPNPMFFQEPKSFEDDLFYQGYVNAIKNRNKKSR